MDGESFTTRVNLSLLGMIFTDEGDFGNKLKIERLISIPLSQFDHNVNPIS